LSSYFVQLRSQIAVMKTPTQRARLTSFGAGTAWPSGLISRSIGSEIASCVGCQPIPITSNLSNDC